MNSVLAKTIPVARPSFGAAEERAVLEVLRSGWVSQGPRVGEFEQRFAEYVGAREAVAVSSCTTALHLALVAAGMQQGDEVLCPSLSFVATANAIVCAGASRNICMTPASSFASCSSSGLSCPEKWVNKSSSARAASAYRKLLL